MKKIDTSSWKEFPLGKLFDIYRPIARTATKYDDGDIPFIASGNYNNGIEKYVLPKDNEIMDKGNCITVSPVDGSCFYQEKDFLGRGGAGSSILILRNENLNKYNSLFICSIIKKICSKYSFNNMGSLTKLKTELIYLPIDKEQNPNWQQMENYVKNIENKISNYLSIYLSCNTKKIQINTSDWKEFYIKDIFKTIEDKKKPQVPTGASVSRKNLLDGNQARISVKGINNGIIGYFCSKDKNYRVYKNFISISFLGTIFYHEYEASLDMKVHCLKPKLIELNKYIALFLVTSLKKMLLDYSYTNQISSTILPNMKFKLPVNDKGNPNYKEMEIYIKNLMQNKQENLKILNYC